MITISGKNLAQIIKRTLNLVNYRVMDHGERVAYIVVEMLRAEGTHTEQELAAIALLCLLHDVGAFKTEELDALLDNNLGFDIRNTADHAVYGYLFIKLFAGYEEKVDAILYHHTRYDDLAKNDCRNPDLAAKIFLADRIDVLLSKDALIVDEHLFEGYAEKIFAAKDIALFIRLDQEKNIVEKLQEGDYQEEILALYDHLRPEREETIRLLRTMAFAIDFRSEFTVVHTMTTVALSVEIARCMQRSEEEMDDIFLGALLHDLGKIATSILLLEKSGRLNDFEYNLIKDHVVVTEKILKGLVEESVFRIAVRHHEKLDGTGYPEGLLREDLTTAERIVAVADVFSALWGKRSYKEAYPEAQIKHILKDMAETGKLDEEVIAVILERYTEITERAEQECKTFIEKYYSIGEQLAPLKQKLMQ